MHGYESPSSFAMQCAVMCEGGVTVHYKSHEEQKDTHQLRGTNKLQNAKQHGNLLRHLKFTRHYAKS